MRKQIIVTNCHDCPFSRIMKVRDGAFCGHTDSSNLVVKHHDETIHSACPLDDYEGVSNGQ